MADNSGLDGLKGMERDMILTMRELYRYDRASTALLFAQALLNENRKLHGAIKGQHLKLVKTDIVGE